MDSTAERERARCVSICRRRAKMWLESAARDPVAGALQEAAARANEAAYLADLLESGVDVTEAFGASGSGPDA